MVSTVSLYSSTAPSARSKKRACQSSPSAPRRRWMALLELCFTDLMTSEIVTGYVGAQMACQGSGRKTPAVR